MQPPSVVRNLHSIDNFLELKRIARWPQDKLRTLYDPSTTQLRETWRQAKPLQSLANYPGSSNLRKNIWEMLKHNHEEMLESTGKSRSLMNLSFINVLKKNGEMLSKRRQHKVKNDKRHRQLDIELPVIVPDLKVRTSAPSEQTEKAVTSFTIAIQKIDQRSISRFFGFREGACLIQSEKQLLLYGGFAGEFDNNRPHLHSFDLNKRQWSQLQIAGDPPLKSFIGSTVEEWKGNFYFIGGMSINLFSKKHMFATDIAVLNLQRGEWSKGRTIEGRRYHTSTHYLHNVIIYGGINEKEEYLGSIVVASMQDRALQQVYNLPDDSKGIAYHRIVSTMDLEAKKRMNIKKDGVYCFGGKNNEGQFLEGLRVLNMETNSNGDLVPKEWIRVKADGIHPKPRVNHSMSLLPRLTSLCIIGGHTQHNEVLKDIHILNLLNLNWYQPQIILDEGLGKGLSGHCATVVGSKIYIFGGLRSDARYSTDLLEIETDQTRVQCCIVKSKKSAAESRHSQHIVM